MKDWLRQANPYRTRVRGPEVLKLVLEQVPIAATEQKQEWLLPFEPVLVQVLKLLVLRVLFVDGFACHQRMVVTPEVV